MNMLAPVYMLEGFSEPAIGIQKELKTIFKTMQPTKRLVACNDILEAFIEGQDENWAGYASRPISKIVYQNALDCLYGLTSDIENPEIGLEADGCITFEWFRNPSRLVSVSIGEDRKLHYAAMLGGRKAQGAEPFYGEFPQQILTLIRGL